MNYNVLFCSVKISKLAAEHPGYDSSVILLILLHFTVIYDLHPALLSSHGFSLSSSQFPLVFPDCPSKMLTFLFETVEAAKSLAFLLQSICLCHPSLPQSLLVHAAA